MSKYCIQSIDQKNIFLIEKFLEKAGSTLSKFRYFSKRTLSSIENHLTTLVVIEADTDDLNVVGYGHLDREVDNVWLGIAIAERAQRLGLGEKMMAELVNRAKDFKLTKILLAVDNDNQQAVHLYHKFNFVRRETRDTYSIFELLLDGNK